MLKMKKLLKKLKSNIALVLAAVITFTAVFGAMIYFAPNSTQAEEVEVVPDKIGFAGQTYSQSNPIKILEVVPSPAYSEIGYMAGVNGGFITWEQIKAINDPDKFMAVFDAWVSVLNGLDSSQGATYVQFDFAGDDKTWYADANAADYGYTKAGSYFSSNGISTNAEKMAAYKAAKIRLYNSKTGEPYYYYKKNNNDVEKVYTTNVLAYAIFGNYNMCDKLSVTVATPSQLRTDDSNGAQYNVNNYKLIYFNLGANIGNYSYQLYNNYMTATGKSGLTAAFTGDPKYADFNEDLKDGPVTWNIYYNMLNNDCALMFDGNVKNIENGGIYQSNIKKLYALTWGINKQTVLDKFMTEHTGTGIFGTYSGDYGSINTDTLEIKYRASSNQSGIGKNDYNPDAPVPWRASMFDSATYNPYANSWGNGNSSTDNKEAVFVNIERGTGINVNKNTFVNNSDNTLGNALLPNTDSGKSGISGNVTGTTNEELLLLFGDRNNKVLNAYVIQYILGLFAGYSENLKSIRVLEIEPANSFRFSNDQASADYILENYLNKNKNMGINVNVTQTTMNGFVAMTEDLINNYDLIILGNKTYYGNNASSGNYLTFANSQDVNVGGINIEAVGYVSPLSLSSSSSNQPYNATTRMFLAKNKFKESGRDSINDITLSGNDISMTALYKVLKYINAGKPMAIANSIFENTIEDKVENIYKLSKQSLEAGSKDANSLLNKKLVTKNVIGINKDGSVPDKYKSKLKISNTPKVEVYEGLKYQYDGSTGIVQANSSNCVSSYTDADGDTQVTVNFNYNNSLRIGTEKNRYRVEIFLDSDGNGLITDSDNRPINTIVTTNYKGYVTSDDFTVTLPAGMRGYVAWKIVVSSVYEADVVVLDESKLSPAEATGAILNNFKAPSDIKVLQILPLTGNLDGDTTAQNKYANGTKSYQDAHSKANTAARNARAVELGYKDEAEAKMYAGITLDLKRDADFQGYFNDVKDVAGIGNFDVTTVTIDEFEGTATNKYKNNGEYKRLSDYKMLVFGFADNFNGQDIKSKDALDAIDTFIKAGNAVLLSHDTLIYSAYSDANNSNVDIHNSSVSYNLTSRFRDTFGMDRFRTSVAGSNYKGTDKLVQGFSNLFCMRYGSAQSGQTAITSSNEYKMFDGMTGQNGGNSSKTDNFSVVVTREATNVNSGQITDYPYKLSAINEGDTLPLTQTHSQWFQLDVEASGRNYSYMPNDVVVWYTLADTKDKNSYYGLSGNDAVNNYYIYSKDNITYTGFGHSGNGYPLSTDKVTVAEYKLFVNTIIKALASAGNNPIVKVTSAEAKMASNIEYVQKIRATDFESGSGTALIKFYAYDEDLGKASTAFLGDSAEAYWDVNGDGEYKEDDDILIPNAEVTSTGHAWNTVYSNDRFTINLKDLKNLVKGDEKLEEQLYTQKLVIGINVYDSTNKKGTAKIQCIYTDVFNLD